MEGTSSTVVREATSRKLSKTMDEYGYSARRRAIRIVGSDKCSVAKTLSTRKILQNENIDKVFVGSCREGIALEYESDQDILQINNNVICQDQLNTEEAGDAIVFQLVRDNAPAGYTCLKFVTGERNAYMKVIRPALLERNGEDYLSSKEFMKINEDVFCQNKGCIGRNTVYKERKGPSIPKYVKHDINKKYLQKQKSVTLNTGMDFVKAFQCSCPDLLQAWCTRTRTGDWPSEETINQVSNTQMYVVPVGEKESANEDLQWRISFVLAEICLVRSLNDTQTKVLILLRHVTRHLLSPICDGITSYIMKNVMFWLAETCPIESFQEKFLLDRLEDALNFLKSCVQHRKLDCYMLPERNILKGKLNNHDQKVLVLEIERVKGSCATFIQQVMECKDLQGAKHLTLYEGLTELSALNGLDIASSFQTINLSTNELEEYSTFMFHTSYSLKATFYHKCHVTWPLWVKYKLGMLKDLESIEVCEKQVPTMSVTVEPSLSITSESNSDIPATNIQYKTVFLMLGMCICLFRLLYFSGIIIKVHENLTEAYKILIIFMSLGAVLIKCLHNDSQMMRISRGSTSKFVEVPVVNLSSVLVEFYTPFKCFFRLFKKYMKWSIVIHIYSRILSKLRRKIVLLFYLWLSTIKLGMLKDLESIEVCEKQVPTMSVTVEPSLSITSESNSDIPATNIPQESALKESTPSPATTTNHERKNKKQSHDRKRSTQQTRNARFNQQLSTYHKRKFKQKSHKRERSAWQARNAKVHQQPSHEDNFRSCRSIPVLTIQDKICLWLGMCISLFPLLYFRGIIIMELETVASVISMFLILLLKMYLNYYPEERLRACCASTLKVVEFNINPFLDVLGILKSPKHVKY